MWATARARVAPSPSPDLAIRTSLPEAGVSVALARRGRKQPGKLVPQMRAPGARRPRALSLLPRQPALRKVLGRGHRNERPGLPTRVEDVARARPERAERLRRRH